MLAICLLHQVSIAQKPELIIKTGHTEAIYKPIFSDDDKYIITTSDDASAKMWETATGNLIKTFHGKTRVTAASLTPDNSKLTITDFDENTDFTYNTRTGRILSSTGISDNPTKNGFGYYRYRDAVQIYSLNDEKKAFTIKGTFLYVVLDSKWPIIYMMKKDSNAVILQSYSFPEGKLLKSSEPIPTQFKNLAADVYKNEIIGVFTSDTLRLLSLPDLVLTKTMKTGRQNIYDINFSETSADFIACYGADSSVNVLNIPAVKFTLSVKNKDKLMDKASFSPDNRWLMTQTGWSGGVKIYDLLNQKEANGFYVTDSVKLGELKWPRDLKQVIFSPDNSKMLLNYDGGLIRIYSCVNYGMIQQKYLSEHYWGELVFNHAGAELADYNSSNHSYLALIDAKTLTPKFDFFRDSHGLQDFFFDNINHRVVFARALDKRLFYFDLLESRLHILRNPLDSITYTDNSAGKVDTNKAKSHVLGWDNSVDQILINKVRNELITVDNDQYISIWDRTTLKLKKTFLATDDDIITAITISDDGKYMATGTREATIRIWDTDSNKVLKKYGAPAHWSSSLLFSPDSKYLASKHYGGGANLIIYDWKADKNFTCSSTTDIEGMVFNPANNNLILNSYHGISVVDPKVENIVYDLIDTTIQGFTSPLLDTYTKVKTDYTKIGNFQAVGISTATNELYIYHGDSTLMKRNLNTFAISGSRKIPGDAIKIDDVTKKMIVTTAGKPSAVLEPSTLSTLGDSTHDAGMSKYVTGYDSIKVEWDNGQKMNVIKHNKNIGTLVSIGYSSWAAVDTAGLFDATPDAMKSMYFVIPNDTGNVVAETIEFDQLKHRYYQPSLIPILFGYKNEKLRQVPTFGKIELSPEIKVGNENEKLTIEAKNRGGGIGKISVFIDNNEIIEDARPSPSTDVSKFSLQISVNLNNYKHLINYDTLNIIKVIAFNGDGWLSSRSVSIDYNPNKAKGAQIATTEKKIESPKFYALIVGTSDYAGINIDLKYAAKDAVDFSAAIKMGASNLFGAINTSVNTLQSDDANENKQPTKSNFSKAINTIASLAKPQDVIVLYLSGHGVNYGGQDGDFYYLTAGASSAGAEYLDDKAIRQSVAISSKELTDYLNRIPSRKKILILDACGSGKAAENMILATRDVPASQTRAIDRMADRTGFYVLSGSAADAVSYESSKYGQGLLTYALLEAIRGAALRIDGNEEYIDVHKLLQFAVDEVPKLAEGFGGIQRPLYRSPAEQRSYDIGRIDEQAKKQIILAQPKPVLTASNFIDINENEDDLKITQLINANLMEIASKGKSAELLFIDAKDYPGAWKLSGNYKVDGKTIILNYRLRHEDKKYDKILSGEIDKLGDFIKALLNEISPLLKASH